MAEYFGAELVGIVRLKQDGGENYPYAVICAVHADYDPRTSPGIGGQVPVQNGLFITFVLSAWIRELGFRASAAPDADADQLAAAAGLGTLDTQGRLVTAKLGAKVHIANVIRTDLPLAPDGSQSSFIFTFDFLILNFSLCPTSSPACAPTTAPASKFAR